MTLHFLVVEGNTRADREPYRATFGRTASQSYAETLKGLAPDADCEICFPADPEGALPEGAGLESFDAVFITGSALNVYDGGPAIERQIELARAVFASRTPLFGSCWGLQVASVAAGGVVVKNPRGREIGVARNIRPNAAGRAHPLLAGRSAVFDALCSHIDHVETAPEGGRILASNAMSEVQAIEIAFAGGLFWGVQYHPEYSLTEVASIISRRAAALAREAMFPDEGAAKGYAEELVTLEHDPSRVKLAERLELGADVREPAQRQIELSNFIERLARPFAAQRGRG
jgi:GMP synthase (glutamine-hydrolysing)